MRFIHHDLGNQDGGNMVLVTLKGNAANVRLMDQSNFSNYRAGRRHRSDRHAVGPARPGPISRTHGR